jgi:hypothetical protein
MLQPNGGRGLLAREAVVHLCSNSGLFVHDSVPRCRQAVRFVVPEKRKSFRIHTQKLVHEGKNLPREAVQVKKDQVVNNNQ